MDNEQLEHHEGEDTASEDKILKRLTSFGVTLMMSHSLEATLLTILNEVAATSFDRARLYILTPDRQFMVCQAVLGMPDHFIHHARPVDNDCYLQKLLNDPRPHIFRRQEGHTPTFDDYYGPTEWACIPLMIEGRVIGELSVDNVFSGKPLVTENLKIASLFASQASAAIEVARRSHALETFSKVAATVSSTLDLEEVLRRTCQSAKELFDTSHSALVLFDDNYEFGHVEAEYPVDTGFLGTKLPLRGWSGKERLVRSRMPIVMEDVAAELSQGDLRSTLLAFDIQSLLVVPVVSRDRVLGYLSLDAIGHKRLFTAEEVTLCGTLATQAAISFENARRFQQITQQLGRVVEDKSSEGDNSQVFADPDHDSTNQIDHANLSGRYLMSTFSESRLNFYLLVSAFVGFILLSAITDQELIVALCTLNIAIIGMCVWALLNKVRALTQSLTPSKGDLPEV